MKRKIRQIFCALTVVSLITGSIPVSAFATVDEGGQIGSDDMMISPDYDAAEITVLGEDGKPLSTDDEAYKNALEKYNGFFSQLDGKTFDASNNDMTDLIIDQMNEMEGVDDAQDEDGISAYYEEESDELSEDIVVAGDGLPENNKQDMNGDSAISEGDDASAASGDETFNTEMSAYNNTAVDYSTLKNPTVKDGKSTWDCVWFGSCMKVGQTSDAGGLIKWRILEIKGNTATLMCETPFIRDMVYSGGKDKTYKNSAINTFLKGDFRTRVLTYKEKDALRIVADNNSTIIPTWDMLNDSRYGFTGKDSRKWKSDYWISDMDQNDNCYVSDGEKVRYKLEKEYIKVGGYNVINYGDKKLGVRPVIGVDLSKKGVWSYAGTVCSDGTMNEVVPSGARVIKLDATGGSIDVSTVKLDKEKNMIPYNGLPDPVRKGYDFLGWYDKKDKSEGGNRYVVRSVVPGDVDTLYARWRDEITAKSFIMKGDNMKIDLPEDHDDIPFFNRGLEFDFAGLNASFFYDKEEGTYEVGIGFDILAVKENAEERGFNPKKYFGGEAKDLEKNIMKAWEALDTARMNNISKPIKVQGEVEPAFYILGYAEGTVDDEGLMPPTSGRLCIYFECYYNGQWQTAIVFIPVTLKLRFGGNGTLSFVIEQNKDKTYNLAGEAEIIFPDIELRAGIGLAYVASVGVYGAASSVLDMRYDSDGFSGKWFLKGEAGMYATFLAVDYKKCILKTPELKIADWGNYYSKTGGVPTGGTGEYVQTEEYGVTRTGENALKDWYDGQGSPDQRSGAEDEDVNGLEFEAGELSEGRVRLLGDMYNNPVPKIAQTKDAAVLVFTADDNQELTGNHTDVYYSVWDDTKREWGQPENIDANAHDTAEFYPDIAACGDDIWAVWMDSEEKLTPAESEILDGISGEDLTDDQKEVLSKLASAMVIKAAKFDKTSGEFGEAVSLARPMDPSNLDVKPRIAYAQGRPYVAWLCDSNPDMDFKGGTSDTGTEQIKYAYLDGVEWNYGEIDPGNVSVTDIAVGEFSGKTVIVYGIDEDRCFDTTEDVALYAVCPGEAGDEIKLSEAGNGADNPQFTHIGDETVVIWYEKNGEEKTGLKYTATLDPKDIKGVHFDDSSALSPDFKVMDDSAVNDGVTGTTLIVSTVGSDEAGDVPDGESNREISAYILDEADPVLKEDGYGVDAGSPIRIKNTGMDGSVDVVTGLWSEDADGESDLILVYTESEVDFKNEKTFDISTSLYMTDVANDEDIIIDDYEVVDVEPEDIEYGETIPLECTVKNASFEDMDAFNAQVTYGDKVLFDEKIDMDEALEAGDSMDYMLDVKLPENVKLEPGSELTLTVTAPEDEKDIETDTSDNVQRYNVGDTNLVLKQEVWADKNAVSVNYVIENTSIFDTTGKFGIYRKNVDGTDTLLAESEELTIGAKDSLELCFDEDMIAELTSYGDVITAKVITDAQESYTADNDDLFRVTQGYIDEVKVSESKLELAVGESKELGATVVPEKLSDIGVNWTSMDESVAVVDRYGRVTAVAAGSTMIIAAANDSGGALAEVSVNVYNADVAALGDTDVLIPYADSKGRMKGYQLSLSENRTSATVTVAKGNKFVLANAVKGSFGYKDQANKKIVGVNKKGVVKAKKPTENAVILYTDSRTGKTVEVTVRVREMKFEGSKNLKTTVSLNSAFDLQPQLLLNAQFKPKNEKYKNVVPDFKYDKDSKGNWHLTGKPAGKGSVSIPVYVYGKKFNLKIKVKS